MRVEQHGEESVEVMNGGRENLCGFVGDCLATRTQISGIIERGSVEWTEAQIAVLEQEAREGLGPISRAIADGFI